MACAATARGVTFSGRIGRRSQQAAPALPTEARNRLWLTCSYLWELKQAYNRPGPAQTRFFVFLSALARDLCPQCRARCGQEEESNRELTSQPSEVARKALGYARRDSNLPGKT
jgi:hypothetical protein